MSFSPSLEQARVILRERFGYADFRSGQERAVSSVLARMDTLVVLPTGGGKSLCYQIPALMLPNLTVVVSPLISLMKDQVDALTTRGIPAAFINSTLSSNEVADRLARAQRGDLKLLYVAPERFDAGGTAERLRAIGVSLLAVDEAHCISEWGHDFRPSYLRIRAVRAQLGEPPTIALTATATPEVRRDIARQLALRFPETIITGFDRTNLSYHVIRTRSDSDKDDALACLLRDRDGLCVVYASTRKAVERITAVLERSRVRAVSYHAGLDDQQRRAVQEAFMNEEARVIVATNAFGMGIDKPNVRLVVHHAMPGTLEAYYQEAGRAGRDGKGSDCVLLHAFPDRFTHEYFIKGTYPEREALDAIYGALAKHADASGLVLLSPADVAAQLGGKIGEREVVSALRLFAKSDVLSNEPESSSHLFVRLLASPARIKRELGEDDAVDRDLLRALWRALGSRLQEGATVDSGGLPPGFGGSAGVRVILDRLQNRQFVLWERSGGGVRLIRAKAPLSSFAVDWKAYDRRRAADKAKLDSVQRYAYTTGCRRGFLLRYFGDPAARPSCRGCDNCLGTHVQLDKSADRRPRARRRVRAPDRPVAASTEQSGALSPTDTRLFESLRSLRGSIAREEKVPAYVIFPDRALAEMARRRPRSRDALGNVHGVGPARLDKYGERVLALIQSADGIEAT